MKNNSYREKAKQIIAHKAGLESKEILDDMFFGDDLNIGELELTEILEELEETFTIELVDVQGELESVKDLLDALEERLD
jgi:acyl carrier protein